MNNGVTYEIVNFKDQIKIDRRTVEMSMIEVVPLKIREFDSNEKVVLMKTVHVNSKSTLLIQGFSNGRLKIISSKTNKIVFNLRCVNDES